MIPDQEEIRDRVKKFFNTNSKLGMRNGVNSKTLFQDILDVNPETLSRIEQKYYWGLVKAGIRMVRTEILIISKNGKHFVAETREEVDHYKDFITKNIRNCERANKRAEEWFKEQKWKRLGRL